MISREDVERYFPNASKSFIEKNCEPMARRLCSAVPEPDQRSQSEDSPLAQGQGRTTWRVLFIVSRRRLLDTHDNERMALKPLADHVTRMIGLKSDSDPRITWEYHQFKTNGPVGTHLLIEVIEPMAKQKV